jgi:hypothetical protein
MPEFVTVCQWETWQRTGRRLTASSLAGHRQGSVGIVNEKFSDFAGDLSGC